MSGLMKTRGRVPRDPRDEQAEELPHLHAGQADALALVHGLEHSVTRVLMSPLMSGTTTGVLLELRVRPLDDVQAFPVPA